MSGQPDHQTLFSHSLGGVRTLALDPKAADGKPGYSAIVVGDDDGDWEGEAVKDGRIVEFHADGETGRITTSVRRPRT